MNNGGYGGGRGARRGLFARRRIVDQDRRAKIERGGGEFEGDSVMRLRIAE